MPTCSRNPQLCADQQAPAKRDEAANDDSMKIAAVNVIGRDGSVIDR